MEKKMNDTAKYAVKILKKYAKEKGTMVRGTSDLSPLEEWLIKMMYTFYKILNDKED